MASTYTPNKNYDKQGTGDNPGAWGPPLNANFDLIDSNLGATLTVPLTNVNVTLSQSQCANLAYVLTGTLTGSVNINFQQDGGFYLIKNDTTGNFTVTIKTTHASGLTLLAPQGFTIAVYSNGTDMLPWNNAVPGNFKVPGDLSVAGTLSTSTQFAFNPPGGRLTLTSDTPVLNSDVTGATTIYYTPYLNSFACFYDGTSWLLKTFSETSQTLSDTTKSPAATTINSNYDLFLWDDSGTIRCTRGPAWTSDSARGTGAGTTEIARTNGIYLNANTITNGPAANRGIYVGTIRTNSSNQVDYMIAPSAVSGGSNNRLYIWNMYNRVDVNAIERDAANSWTFTTLNTWQPYNGSGSNTNNRISVICGLREDSIFADFNAYCSSGGNAFCFVGIALNSTSTPNCSQGVDRSDNTGFLYQISSIAQYMPALGVNYIQALEGCGAGANAQTYYGDNGDSNFYQSALIMNWRM
jgi:hypothetical protein